MGRPRYTETQHAQGGFLQFIDLEVTAPWPGHNHTASIQFEALPTVSENLRIIKTGHLGDGTPYDLVLLEFDPSECDETSVILLAQVALDAGDSISITYANSDNQDCDASITLEGA